MPASFWVPVEPPGYSISRISLSITGSFNHRDDSPFASYCRCVPPAGMHLLSQFLELVVDNLWFSLVGRAMSTFHGYRWSPRDCFQVETTNQDPCCDRSPTRSATLDLPWESRLMHNPEAGINIMNKVLPTSHSTWRWQANVCCHTFPVITPFSVAIVTESGPEASDILR